ncbi:unnamed protein product [Adineta ricciae]|uniref:Major facilitator superfamily (MFS) profile domain-containing protein n=1 Tax=Adineta ricciae TaxID=249248 RepID=A0A814M9N2_ADIRI|nr:unnamed protein product [Adineta ricciae]CAF1399216.1 unnamed protein product [Adineta ricciae]
MNSSLSTNLMIYSLGHAKLMDIGKDIDLSTTDQQLAVSLFFVAYLIFELPNIFLMRYLGPASYLPISIFAWGSLTVGMAFVSNAQALFAVRFLLGIAQAAFFPSLVIYISLWYPKKYHMMRLAILYGAAIIAGALGSILAYGFKKMDGSRNLNGWQWMFLIEGLPMIPFGIATFFLLSNIPDNANWLTMHERNLLINILLQDTPVVQFDHRRLSWRQVSHAFIDRRVYLYVLITTGVLGIVKYLTTYLPSIIKDMGTSTEVVQLMTAPPYGFAFLSCLLVAYSSSRKNEHGLHLVFCLFVGLLGFILLVTVHNFSQTGMYVIGCVICCGVFSALPILLSWATNNIDGHTKKSIAIGFMIGAGQLGGIIFPLINDDISTSRRNNLICVGILAVSLIATIILRVCLIVENRRRERLTSEEYEYEANIKESCDWHPGVRYTL